MEKEMLLKNILLELNQLPEAYLKHWFEMIHTFRAKLPVQEETKMQPTKEEIDWDAFIKTIMDNRQQDNQQRFERMKALMVD